MPRSVVIIGQLASMSRAEAARVITLSGGELSERLTRSTALVVVGSRGPQLQRSGRPSIQIARAQRLIEEGCPLEVWAEERWLQSVGLVEEAAGVRRRFTAGQIAETLRISRAKLDRWLAVGLITPVEESAGIPLYEFQQVAAVRALAELLQSGVSLAKVRRAIAHLAAWFPSANQPLMELNVGKGVRSLVVRTASGRLAEPTGQLLLEFDRDESIASLAFCKTESEADAFRRAVQCEEEQPLQAVAIYRELIAKRGPHATLEFNLANALYAAEDAEGALTHYQQATEYDALHVGAWNNMANVLAELDRPEQAILAYRRALQLDPCLSDARFNLAQTLVENGRSDEAILHWRAYLAADSESAWADYARERIESTSVCQ